MNIIYVHVYVLIRKTALEIILTVNEQARHKQVNASNSRKKLHQKESYII